VAIVLAATELFIRDGYLQTTMAGIAQLAGVAVQTL
jgi:AcrR family transcriptional regulator